MKFFTLLILVISVTGCGWEVDPRTLWHNSEGVKEVGKKDPAQAQREFLKALGIDPFVSEIHSNLGNTYLELKQSENALKSFESAEKWARNPDAHFVARFNQGVTRTLDKKVEEALLAYQRALEVRPDSIETKTNIELLMAQQAQQDGQGEGEGQQGENQQDSKEGESEDKKNKEYKNSQQYQMKEFKGDLSQEDVKKILGELKQQEQKIRGQYYKNEVKESPLDKDW